MSGEQHEQNLADLLKDSGYHQPQEVVTHLPKIVKKRVCGLKKLQADSIQIEAEFYKRVHDLEREFEGRFHNIFEERRKIVNGEREPTEEEAAMPLIQGMDEEELKQLYEQSEPDNGEKGIPDFWFTVLKSSEATMSMIQEHDEPVLKYLTNIHSITTETGFIIEFSFAPNPYFKNTVLRKKYTLEIAPEKDVFDYEGPECKKIDGDTIEWEANKDVTKKVVKKKAKKGPSAGKFLTKTVKADSFFNFFDTPTPHDPETEAGDMEDDGDMDDLFSVDYDIATTLRDTVIPRAVLIYTGELFMDDEDFDEFDDEEDEDDESDDE